jgi:hypothetical protein
MHERTDTASTSPQRTEHLDQRFRRQMRGLLIAQYGAVLAIVVTLILRT